MSWLRLTINTTAERVEGLTALLEQFNACSVSYQPISNENIFDNENQNIPVVWQQTSVTALLDPETDLDILLACIRNRIGTENICGYHVEPLADADWTDAHKQGFHRMIFAGNLVVRPGWEPAGSPGLAEITLEPGLAFGTGKHATTWLCLDWLARHELSDKTVIDYGCGSGILSLAAARLGAGQVFAVDIDPQALLATRQNAERNRLQDKIRISAAPCPGLPQAEILVANILLNPLIQMAPVFAGLVRTGGDIVLSGLLATQLADCLACYRQWFKMELPEYRDEWSLLHGQRLAST